MKNIIFDQSLLRQINSKTAIVTGAANGIGAETVRLLNHHGANVVIADLPSMHSKANTVIASLSHPTKALFVPTSITNWVQTKDLFKKTISKFGSVEIVCLNAAIMETSPTLALDRLDEDGDLEESREAFRVIDVNLKGTLNCLRLALFHMQSNKPCFADSSRGSIVLTLSISSYFGGTGVSAYVASKHGALGLLRAAQSTAKDIGVRLNGVAPFFTPTQITAGFASAWKEANLEANTVEGVARAIVHMAMDTQMQGHCSLTAGSYLREMESTRTELMPLWVGEDVEKLMSEAGKLFTDLGGYPLPQRNGKL